MSMELTIQEAFEIAVRIEREAAVFFREAATTASPRSRRALLDLAEMEVEHADVFGALKDKLLGQGPAGASPGDHGAPALAAVVVENVKEHLLENFQGKTFSAEILAGAIDFEVDTIIFYAAMKEMLGDPADREKIDEIILQELSHVLTLRAQSLGPSP